MARPEHSAVRRAGKQSLSRCCHMSVSAIGFFLSFVGKLAVKFNCDHSCLSYLLSADIAVNEV